jgi:uncharacterized protein YihD (DUF1040 family)
MKELSVEQKAKRYDEVIELVNSKWHYRNQPCIIDVSEIFTELKDRYTWKPSDEQMEVLKEALNIAGSKYKSCLNSLYSDLMKLKD